MSQATPSPTTPVSESQILADLIARKELEEKKLAWANWANEQYILCRNARHAFEQQWYLNLAFTAGKQYVAPLNIPGQGFRLTTPKAPPWRVRLVINKVRTAVRTEFAKLTSSKPIPTVLPATNEDEDYSAAAVGELVVSNKFANEEFNKEYKSWIWWGTVCGKSFLKMYWDPNSLDYDAKAVPPPPTFPNGAPIPDHIIDSVPGLREKLNQAVPAKGKIFVERVTPFHIYVPDLLEESIDKQPYVIHAMTKSPEWVRERYRINPVPDSRASNTILDSAHLITKGAEEHLDSVLVKEVWIKAGFHRDFPNGGFLVIINDKVVNTNVDWPYPFPEYPFYEYNGIPTGGFYPDSIVVDLIPVQKEYNRKRSQIIEIQNTMGKPRILYARGSVDPRRISSEPGQSVEYIPGYEKPDVMQGVEVPISFINEVQQLQQEFDDISGQHEISRGQTPTNAISSGTAISALQEQDDLKLSPNVSSIENACAKLGKHYLIMASEYWNEERILKITGENNTFEALHWKKGMLRGNNDVKIQTGSALPYSKAARTALLTEFMANGWVAPEAGLEILDMGGLSKVIDDALVDKRQAVRENLKMADIPESMLQLLLEPAPGPNGEEPIEMEGPNGEPIILNGDGTPFQPQPPVPVNSWDDHEQHIKWHNHFRKTQQFELLSESHKKAFELHVQLHQIALMQGMVNQQGIPLDQTAALPSTPVPLDPEMDQGGSNEPPVE